MTDMPEAREPDSLSSDVDEFPVESFSMLEEEGSIVVESAVETPERDFEELTLSEVLGRLLRAPGDTLARLSAVAQTPKQGTVPVSIASSNPRLFGRPVMLAPATTAVDAAVSQPAEEVEPEDRGRQQADIAKLGIFLSAFIITWYGTGTMVSGGIVRSEDVQLVQGAFIVVIGFFLWLVGEFATTGTGLISRLRGLTIPSKPKNEPQADEIEVPAQEDSVSALLRDDFIPIVHPARIFLIVLGALTSLVAFSANLQNHFTTIGFWAWMASVVFWVGAFAPSTWGTAFVSGQWITEIQERARGFSLRNNPTMILLLLIVLFGAYFRLSSLGSTPPEMTSDHVEKILDSNRVLFGETQVFFPNNGGREPIQMYLMAALSQVPGLGMNFMTLKLLSALEGIITIPILFWLGREIGGENNRQFGNILGLTLAGLVAVSYWHEVLSRLGLRIVLTPLFTAFLLIYLVRAIRHNQRVDFIKAGLALGFGLYAYQAVRMLPVVVLVGIGLALITAVNWRARGRYVLHLAVLVFISFIVFIPLFGFSVQYPEDFWRRTSGRLLGDDVIQTTDESGNIVTRNTTLTERLDAFQNNIPVLADNIRNALLMFNWKGDVAWISNASNYPAMDSITGAFLIVGLAAWIARMIRRRDAAEWLIPLTVFIMLLPSALSVAYTVENPSATRTSGALPGAYLIAALPLSLVAVSTRNVLRGNVGKIAMVGIPLIAMAGVYTLNSTMFFNNYRTNYMGSALPYSEAGRVLHGFAESVGSYGNAFMVGYAYWWDHRAIGLEAGLVDFPNGIDTTGVTIPNFIRGAFECRTDMYRLDPDRYLLFFVAPEDLATQANLARWFPEGYGELRQSYQTEQYYLFYVPPLGDEGLLEFMQHYSDGAQC